MSGGGMVGGWVLIQYPTTHHSPTRHFVTWQDLDNTSAKLPSSFPSSHHRSCMGKALPWVLVHRQVTKEKSERIVDNMKHAKRHTVTVSNLSTCTVCKGPSLHQMRNQILSCASMICAAACVRPLKCPWRCKVLTCLESHLANIYEIGSHEVRAMDPPTGLLTMEQKQKVRELAANGMKPARIRNALSANVPADKIPDLNKVQNFVTHFRKTDLNNTDDLDVLERIILEKAFRTDVEDSDAFSFSSQVETTDLISIGEGTDRNAFLVGFTTKTLLRRMDRDPKSFIFHFDATYKLNQVDYPTFVCGISDHARSFHLVALFVSSQQEELNYTSALQSLRVIYTRVLEKPMAVHYILGDADGAQYNAMAKVFEDCQPETLMCFYHVIAKVHERSSSIPPAKRSLVLADIFDMHYAKTASQFHSKKTTSVRQWLADPDTEAFGKYFHKQWLSGKFVKWQCFRTPIGWATTNNPVETFNAKLKSTYTLRKRMLMGALLGQLQSCCRMESVSGVNFQENPKPTNRVRRRATELRRLGLLVETPAIDSVDDFVLVVSKATPRIYVRPRKKTVEVVDVAAQIGANAARMERDEQPEEGWPVDVANRSCPCKYFFHKGHCVHLLFAFYIRFGTDQPDKRRLHNRSRRNKRKSMGDQIAEAVAANVTKRGRPILNGPALAYV